MPLTNPNATISRFFILSVIWDIIDLESPYHNRLVYFSVSVAKTKTRQEILADCQPLTVFDTVKMYTSEHSNLPYEMMEIGEKKLKAGAEVRAMFYDYSIFGFGSCKEPIQC